MFYSFFTMSSLCMASIQLVLEEVRMNMHINTRGIFRVLFVFENNGHHTFGMSSRSRIRSSPFGDLVFVSLSVFFSSLPQNREEYCAGGLASRDLGRFDHCKESKLRGMSLVPRHKDAAQYSIRRKGARGLEGSAML